MEVYWYPKSLSELNKLLEGFMPVAKNFRKKVHGLVVPHAGYQYSGEVAGSAYSFLKSKPPKKAIIFGPAHYSYFSGVRSIDFIETPFGPVKILENNFDKIDYDHSVENQVPFLQKINPRIEILPLVVGKISFDEALDFAKRFSSFDGVFIFSTDLSHFLNYSEAIEVDRKSISIIEKTDLSKWKYLDACGKFPLLILFYLCKINSYKPRLIMYNNSGDVTGSRGSVVGYSSFVF